MALQSPKSAFLLGFWSKNPLFSGKESVFTLPLPSPNQADKTA